MKLYQPCNIFSANEIVLFYLCLPIRSLAFQGETCTGQKVPTNRISVLCATSMDGSKKLPLLSNGKFQKPRCFKGISFLPVPYKFNKKAWMTIKIFEEWVRKLERRFLLQGRSTALILDNCSAHPKISDL